MVTAKKIFVALVAISGLTAGLSWWSNHGLVPSSSQLAAIGASAPITVNLRYGQVIPELGIDMFTGAKDTGLQADAPNAGFYSQGSADRLVYRFNRMGLYWFDLSAIPADATISDARLILYSLPGTESFDTAGDVPIQLVQSLGPNNAITWKEGAGSSYYSQYQGTSWLAKDSDPNIEPRYKWSNLPGRYQTGDIASAFMSSPIGNMHFVAKSGAQTSDNLASTIQSIISNGRTYEGLVVDKGTMDGVGRKDAIATKEYSDINLRPTLRLTYTIPVTITPTVSASVVPTPTLTVAPTTTVKPTPTMTVYPTPTITVQPTIVPTPTITSPAGFYLETVKGINSYDSAKQIFPVASGSVKPKCQTFQAFNGSTKTNTGYNIRRITDVSEVSKFASLNGNASYGFYNGYSRFPNANVNGQYMYVVADNGQALLYRISDCTYLGEIKYISDPVWGFKGDITESNNPRWDVSGRAGTATTIYYSLDGALYKQDVLVGVSSETLVKNFEGFNGGTGVHIRKMDHSDQSKQYRGIYLQATNWADDRFVVYDLYNNKVLSAIVPGAIDEPDVSPLGTYVYSGKKYYRISDLAAGINTPFASTPTTSHGHDGWAFDYNGDEVHVYQDNKTDWITAFNPKTGQATQVINLAEMGWSNQHIGRISNPAYKGWFLMATYRSNYDGWADNQILMFEIKPYASKPRVWRVSSTYTHQDAANPKDYFAEAFANIDFDGLHINWGGNWNRTDNLEVYRLDLPTDWASKLAGSVTIPTPTVISTPTPTVTIKPTVVPTPTVTVKPTIAPTPTTTIKPTITPTKTVRPTIVPTRTVKPTFTPVYTSTSSPYGGRWWNNWWKRMFGY